MIQQVQVRAMITIGNALEVETPFILKFDVTKTRGQISTFSASIKVHGDRISSSMSGDVIKIYAGTLSSYKSNVIFSGIVKTINVSPCWDDPQYVYLNLTGEDILSVLRGKKYTRRSRASKAAWISIDGVARKGLRSGKLKAKAEQTIDIVHSDTQHEGPVEATALANFFNNVEVAKTGEDPSAPNPAHNITTGGSGF
jgi:hypothetical protein